MQIGNVLVEQVTATGLVVRDYDQSLSPAEIRARIENLFPNVEKSGSAKVIRGAIDGHKYAIRIKNITYLGVPHPHFKKRIQIAEDLPDFVRSSLASGYTPLLLGIYTYKENTVFCDFNVDDYIHKMANNSSAHVSVNDLREATRFGFFEKTDMFNNRIMVFSSNNVAGFLRDKLGLAEERNPLLDMIKSADAFVLPLNRYWLGIDAYREMHSASYKNWRQGEWPGFYFEYLLDNFLEDNPEHRVNIDRGSMQRGKGKIDLDVFYPQLEMYGDLKAHTVKTQGIIGNDCSTVEVVLGRTTKESIYYIVASGIAEKDKAYNSVTSRYYSELKGSPEPSYVNRMKYSFKLTEYYVLDLNNHNLPYTTLFNQGRNSNGEPRPPKVLFPEKALDNFVIHRKQLL